MGILLFISVLLVAANEPIAQAPKQKSGDNRAIGKRAQDRGFHQPVVVNHTTNCTDIDEPVEHLPAASAKPANPSGCGSERQRNQQNKSSKTHSNERAFVNILPDGG